MRVLTWCFSLLLLAGGCASFDEPYGRDQEVPADVEGSWVGMRDDRTALTLVLRQHEDSVTGFIDDSAWKQVLVYGRVRGDSLTLRAENHGAMELSGRMNNDRLTGMWSNGQNEMGGWWARRR